MRGLSSLRAPVNLIDTLTWVQGVTENRFPRIVVLAASFVIMIMILPTPDAQQ